MSGWLSFLKRLTQVVVSLKGRGFKSHYTCHSKKYIYFVCVNIYILLLNICDSPYLGITFRFIFLYASNLKKKRQ